jgi:hypothetical protein
VTAVVVGAVLTVAAVVLVALPFLREPSAVDDRLDARTPDEERRLALIEERDHALAALKELEFDHRTGKIGDDDYRAVVGPLRRAAAEALRTLDRNPGYGPAMTPTTMIEEPTPAPGAPAPGAPAPVPEPAPPPDEGTPPTPAPVPEPYPPPDEATPPSPPGISPP